MQDFVGRDRELEELSRLIPSGPTASGSVAVIVGHALCDKDHLTAVEAYRRLIEPDRYDQAAHLGLLEVLGRMGGGRVLERAWESYESAMSAIGRRTRSAS